MRRTVVLLALAALACGKDSGSPTPVQPPPPPVPASVTVHAGDAQAAEPGASVPVRPAVIVRSASGVVVPNVAVTFTVDSGGGSVQVGSAVTGTDGVATVGDWRLGPAEGRQSLLAAVTGLPAARFGAVAIFPTVTVQAAQSLPPAGGTLRNAGAAAPFNRIELAVPAGAYGTTTQWTITARRTIPITLPAGASLAGPVVTVENGKAYADSVMALTIPTTVDASIPVGAFYYDSASKWLEPVPIANRGDSSVTIAVRHFNAAALLLPAAAASPRVPGAFASSAPLPFGQVMLVVVAVQPSVLATSLTTSFRPGRDDWEFTNHGSVTEPGGICAGMSVTALYYQYRHAARIGSLYGRYSTVGGFDDDNPQGIRFASTAQTDIGVGWNTGGRAWLTQMRSLAQTTGVHPDVVNFNSLAVTFLVTGRGVVLGMQGIGIGHAVVAFEANAGGILIADVNAPGQSRTVTYQNNRFQPLPFSAVAGGNSTPITRFVLVGVSALLNVQSLDTEWQQFVANKAGARTMPAYEIQVYDPPLRRWRTQVTDTVTVFGDSIVARVLCPTCRRAPGRTPATRQPLSLTDSLGKTLATDTDDQRVGVAAPVDSGRAKLGFDVLAYDSTFAAYFLDFQWITVTPVHTKINRRDVTVDKDSSIAFAALHRRTHPAGARYQWTFSTTGVNDTFTRTGDSTMTYTFRTKGTWAVVLEVESPIGTLVGRDSTSITVEAGGGTAWRFVRVDNVVNPGGTGPGSIAVIDNLITRPTDVVLFVFPTAVAPPFGPAYPTPGAYLQQTAPGAGASLVTFSPTLGLPTFPIAHTVNNPAERVEGSFSWTGSGSVFSLQGRGTPTSQTCGQSLFTVDAATIGTDMSGVLTFTYDRPAGCNGGAYHRTWQWEFDATRVR